MKALRVRVIMSDCVECRDALLADCREFRLPPPTDEFVWVPGRWANHKCSHKEHGLILEVRPAVENETEMDVEILDELEGLNGEGELKIEAPDWWNNLDATKGIGYPVRESGRYGSHPSHDGFDDESWS